ncbi:hypothetical protein Chor_004303 [Crotalus horridus]
MLTPNSSLEKQIGVQIWATTKPILVLLPVLGLTWVCGILVHLSITWAYIFIMLNSLQGLYIFLVYALYNSEVRNAIQRMREKKKALSFTHLEPDLHKVMEAHLAFAASGARPAQSYGGPPCLRSVWSQTCTKLWRLTLPSQHLDPDLHKVMEVHLPSQHLDPDLHKVMEVHLPSQHLDPDLHKVMEAHLAFAASGPRPAQSHGGPPCLRSIWTQSCTKLWRPTLPSQHFGEVFLLLPGVREGPHPPRASLLLLFQNCSHPVNYLSSPRNTSWEMARFNPTTPESTSCSTEKDTTSKSKGRERVAFPSSRQEDSGCVRMLAVCTQLMPLS